MKVDILEHLADGTRRRIATFSWRGGEIECDNPLLWKHLMNSNGGVIIGARGKRFYPRDGAEYLRNLKYQFAGPYLHAGPVEEEDEVGPGGEGGAGVGGGGAPVDVSSLETVKARVPGRSVRSRTSPSARGVRGESSSRRAGRRRVRSATRSVRASESALSREDMEAVYGGVYRAALAVRGLGFQVARAEMEGLLETITRLAGVDRDDLLRAFQSRESYLELRYQPPSRQNYEKLWERARSHWQRFLEILEEGELEPALWPLFMVWEAMRCLPAHRAEWLTAQGFESRGETLPAAISFDEIQASWETHGLTAMRKKRLSCALLDEAFARADQPFQAAVEAFRDASFGRSEVEVRRALAIDPGFIDARLVLGDILRRLDQNAAALVELRHTVELELLRLGSSAGRTRDPASWLRLARARTSLGKTLLGEGRIRAATHQLELGLESLERLGPEAFAGQDEEAARQVRAEEAASHRLLERVYRDLGDVERAGHHRKRLATKP